VIRGDGNNRVPLGQPFTVSAASSAFHLFDAQGVARTRRQPGNLISSKQILAA